MTRMYPTPYLEHHADRFVSLGLHRHGLTLEQYLVDPARIERRYALEPFPLLPKQERVQARLDAQLEAITQAAEAEAGVAHLPRRNGMIVEPLHHHRHHKRGYRADFKPKEKP